MCDWTPVRNWLIATLAMIILAVAAIFVAINLAGVAQSIGMLVAAAFTGLAMLFNSFAIGALGTFCACAGSSCASPCGNLRSTLLAAQVVLGIQVTACLITAVVVLVPFLGQWLGGRQMWAIYGALVLLVGLIAAAFAFMAQLATCQPVPPPKTPTPPTPPTPPVGTGPVG
jgi:hypothetical protein